MVRVNYCVGEVESEIEPISILCE